MVTTIASFVKLLAYYGDYMHWFKFAMVVAYYEKEDIIINLQADEMAVSVHSTIFIADCILWHCQGWDDIILMACRSTLVTPVPQQWWGEGGIHRVTKISQVFHGVILETDLVRARGIVAMDSSDKVKVTAHYLFNPYHLSSDNRWDIKSLVYTRNKLFGPRLGGLHINETTILYMHLYVRVWVWYEQ